MKADCPLCEVLEVVVEDLRAALLDMTYQHAYATVKDGVEVYWTGGLSALEHAFEVLGWGDPIPRGDAK